MLLGYGPITISHVHMEVWCNG